MLTTNLQILISDLAYKKIYHWTMASDLEVGFMGVTKFDEKNNAYLIKDVFLPKQEVSAATTDLDGDAMAALELEALNQYPDHHLNAWIHSHVDMETFWSGTDRQTIEDMGAQGLCVAVVVNKKREMRGAIRVNSKSDFYPSFFMDDVPVKRVDIIAKEQKELWDEAFKANVSKKTYKIIFPENYLGKNLNEAAGVKGTLIDCSLKDDDEFIDCAARDVDWDEGLNSWNYTDIELWQMTKAELEDDLAYWGMQYGLADWKQAEIRVRHSKIHAEWAKKSNIGVKNASNK